MREFIDVTGKTEEEAIKKALDQLNMDRFDVSIEVLERAKSGFLGIGAAPAKVRVFYGEEELEVTPAAPVAPVAPAAPAAPAAARQISRAAVSFFSASMAGRYSADGLCQPVCIASVIAATTASLGRVVALLSR